MLREGFFVTDAAISTDLIEWVEENITPSYDHIAGDTYLYHCVEILEHVEGNKITGLEELLTENDIKVLKSAEYIEI